MPYSYQRHDSFIIVHVDAPHPAPNVRQVTHITVTRFQFPLLRYPQAPDRTHSLH